MRGLLGAGSAAALLVCATNLAQASAISMDPADWTVDRAEGVIFELVDFGGRSSVLQLGISPPAAQQSFYNWQGYSQKVEVSAGSSFIRGDIWLDQDWETGTTTDYVRTGIWGSAMPEADVANGTYVDAHATFPIISFTNVDGVGRLEVWVDGAWVDLPGTADLLSYDGWNTFESRLLVLPEGTKIEYLVNSEVIYTYEDPVSESNDPVSPEQLFAVYLKARNNGVTEFDTYWSRLMAGIVLPEGEEIDGAEGDVLIEDGEPTVISDGAVFQGSVGASGGEEVKVVTFSGSATIEGGVFGENAQFQFATDNPDGPAPTTVIEGNLELESGSSTSGGTPDNPVSVVGNVNVDTNSTFGGNFVVDGKVTNSGSTGPGNSIGMHIYNDELTWTGTHVYEVELGSDGNADLVIVTDDTPMDLSTMGTIEVSTWPAGASVLLDHPYVIFAAPVLSGDPDTVFADVTLLDDLAFLTPSLSIEAGTDVWGGYAFNDLDTLTWPMGFEYTDMDAVVLTLSADIEALLDAVETPNQQAVADTLLGAAGSNAAAAAVFAQPDAAAAQSALNQLSGGIYASAGSLFVEQSLLLEDTMSSRLIDGFAFDPSALSGRSPDLAAPDAGSGALWGRLIGAWSETESDGNAGTLTSSSNGIVLGTDRQLDETWRFGALVGYSSTSFEVEAEQASGTSDALQVGLYGSAQADGLTLRAGAGYTSGAVDIERAVSFAGEDASVSGSYDTDTVLGFAELAYALDLGDVVLEPFAGVSLVRNSGGDYAETGGDAALTGSAAATEAAFTTLGLRTSAAFAIDDVLSARLDAMLGWRHAFGELGTGATHAMAGGESFTVAGTPVPRDSLVTKLGLRFDLWPGADMGLYYAGEFGSEQQSQSGQAQLAVRF